jgi:hypothetical protein
MENVNYTLWQQHLALIAQYDWAVEGFPAPEGLKMSREEAVEMRNQLVKLSGKVEL